MNGPRRTACFAKGMPNYTFFTLDSTWLEYTDLDLLTWFVDNSGGHKQNAILSLADSQTICQTINLYKEYAMNHSLTGKNNW